MLKDIIVIAQRLMLHDPQEGKKYLGMKATVVWFNMSLEMMVSQRSNYMLDCVDFLSEYGQ